VHGELFSLGLNSIVLRSRQNLLDEGSSEKLIRAVVEVKRLNPHGDACAKDRMAFGVPLINKDVVPEFSQCTMNRRRMTLDPPGSSLGAT
jgi:hypothetical protein